MLSWLHLDTLDHGRVQFEAFFEILNTRSPVVKLTSRVEQHSIDFLDIKIYKGTLTQETGLLDVKVFFKSTDTLQLLHKSSFHPKRTFAGILVSTIIPCYKILHDLSRKARIWSCSLSLI